MLDQNLSLYRAFYAVANIGNISSAAERLFISQPAVSKAIRKLEKNMQCKLFVREPRGVTLTHEGDVLYEHVENAMLALEEAEKLINYDVQKGVGILRIGTSIALFRRYLLPYLDVFLKKYPKVRVSLQFVPSALIHAMIRNDELDIGLLRMGLHDEKDVFYSANTLHNIFVAKPSYYKKLGDIKKIGAEKLLAKGTLIVLGDDDYVQEILNRQLREKHWHPNNFLEVNFMDMAIDFAKLGLGISCVFKEFVEEDLANGSLVQIPLPLEIENTTVGFLRLKEKDKALTVHNFWEMLF